MAAFIVTQSDLDEQPPGVGCLVCELTFVVGSMVEEAVVTAYRCKEGHDHPEAVAVVHTLCVDAVLAGFDPLAVSA